MNFLPASILLQYDYDGIVDLDNFEMACSGAASKFFLVDMRFQLLTVILFADTGFYPSLNHLCILIVVGC